MIDYILQSSTPQVRWPGMLLYRSARTKKGRGYPSLEAAESRRRRILSHYAAAVGGSNGCRLDVVKREPAAFALFDALTGGKAAAAAAEQGVSGVEIHEILRGDWLTKQGGEV